MASPQVQTYHCTYCSHLLLATTLHLPSLPTRQAPGLDNAIIAPLPPPPRSPEDSDSDPESDLESSDDEQEQEQERSPQPDPETEHQSTPTEAAKDKDGDTTMRPPPPRLPRPPRPPQSKRKFKDYTLLLSSTRDRTAKIITREDGFEKRYLWRCGRCKVVYGYQLDDIHYPTNTTSSGEKGKDKGKDNDGDHREEVDRRKMRRKTKDYVYFLQGALIPTEELGREVQEVEVGFSGVRED